MSYNYWIVSDNTQSIGFDHKPTIRESLDALGFGLNVSTKKFRDNFCSSGYVKGYRVYGKGLHKRDIEILACVNNGF